MAKANKKESAVLWVNNQDEERVSRRGKGSDSAETITIIYTYPLHKPVSKQFSSKYGPFTVKEFKECVWKGYEEIYASEKEPTQEQRDESLLNRPYVEGGNVWGHDLGDLVLEAWYETDKDGVFELSMGS